MIARKNHFILISFVVLSFFIWFLPFSSSPFSATILPPKVPAANHEQTNRPNQREPGIPILKPVPPKQSAQPAQPVQPVQPVQPAQPAQPAQPKESKVPVQPQEQQKPAQAAIAPAKPVDPLREHRVAKEGAIGIIPVPPPNLKPIGEPYVKTLVISSTKEENVNWVGANFDQDEYIRPAVYVVDDKTAPLHTPENKGHEVMTYLTYIIDRYHNLTDVNIFLHAHENSWHNNNVLGGNAVEMIRRLSSERVQREGYMNLKCGWQGGCPDWVHLGSFKEEPYKEEQPLMAMAFAQLFPFDPVPEVLAQPCCAQFAVSKATIQRLPRETYVKIREWLLRTRQTDYISGRIFEHIWQFIFTGKSVLCPEVHVCYCDGFGVCFGGKENLRKWDDTHEHRKKLQDERNTWIESKEKYDASSEEQKVNLEEPEVGRELVLEGEIKNLTAWLDKTVEEAKKRGDIAQNRAQEAGRKWKDGEGF